MSIYNNTSNLSKMLVSMDNLSRTDENLLENSIIGKTCINVESKEVDSVRPYAFYGCGSLTSVSFPNCTSIGYDAFGDCNSLTIASFPKCSIVGQGAFKNCSNLNSIGFPNCTNISNSAFYSCNSLTTINFPNCSTVGDGAFQYCVNLTTASFSNCTTIGYSAFQYCYNLRTLYLTGSSLCKLLNPQALDSTPIGGYSASAGTYGSIYVPASLVASYKAATNWAGLSSRIFAKG